MIGDQCDPSGGRLSTAVALLASPLEAPLTTKLEDRRREKKCRKDLLVGDKIFKPPIL
jgi:hypothetical protein